MTLSTMARKSKRIQSKLDSKRLKKKRGKADMAKKKIEKADMAKKKIEKADMAKKKIEKADMVGLKMDAKHDRPFLCEECKKRFKRKYHLSVHKKLHSSEGDERPFLCKECKMRFKMQHHLTQHLKIHSLDSPHICTECDQVFPEERYLKRHLKIHTGERPFDCSICGLNFREKKHHIQHMKVHSMEKQFLCETCNTRFKHKKNLYNHMRSHTQERPFVCHKCHRSFMRKDYLARHIKERCFPKESKEKLIDTISQEVGRKDDHEHGPCLNTKVDIHGMKENEEGPYSNSRVDIHGMEDKGEGPTSCEGMIINQKENTEDPSFKGINQCMIDPGGTSTLEGTSFYLRKSNDIHGMENTGEGPYSNTRVDLHGLEYREEGPYSSTRVGIHGIEDRGEGPTYCEGMVINQTENTENPSFIGVNQCMIDPGGASTLEGTNLYIMKNIDIHGMEYTGEGPSYCEGMVINQTENTEEPSFKGINQCLIDQGGASTLQGTVLHVMKSIEIHGMEYREEGPYFSTKVDFHGMGGKGEGPTYSEGMVINQTENTEDPSFKGVNQCMIDPGGASTLEGTNLYLMKNIDIHGMEYTGEGPYPGTRVDIHGMDYKREGPYPGTRVDIHGMVDKGEGPTSCEGMVINQTENTEDPSFTGINQCMIDPGGVYTLEGTKLYLMKNSDIHGTEYRLDGPYSSTRVDIHGLEFKGEGSYSNIRVDIHEKEDKGEGPYSNTRVDIHGMEDKGEGPTFCEGMGIKQTENMKNPCIKGINQCLIDPGGTSTLEATDLHLMKSLEKVPLVCERVDFNHMDTVACPYEKISICRMEEMKKNEISWKGIYILEMEDPEEDIY